MLEYIKFKLLLFELLFVELLIPHIAADHLGIQINAIDGRPKMIFPIGPLSQLAIIPENI